MMNGRYRCVKEAKSWSTFGEIYEFVDDRMTWDNGTDSETCYSLEYFNDHYYTQLEKVEDEFVVKSPKELLEHLDIVTTKEGREFVFISIENNSYFTSLSNSNVMYSFNFEDNLTSDISENKNINKITSQSGIVKWERESENDIQIREIEEKIVELNKKYIEDIEYYTDALAILKAKNGRYYSEQEVKDMGIFDLNEKVD